MATIYGSIIPWRSMTTRMSTSQETNTTSLTSASNVEDTDNLKQVREAWWKTGKKLPKAKWEEANLPYELATNVSWEEYAEKTDKYKIHGWWEWEAGTVRVIQLPSTFHEHAVGAIVRQISTATAVVMSTNQDILNSGSTTTKSRGSGKEADSSFTPLARPRVNRGGSDGRNQPWPSLVVEVAYTVSEGNTRTKVENYWLHAGRAHDVIMLKIDEPIAPATIPSCMTAWHYCVNNVTPAGALNPIMYEFGTVDRQGAQINTNPPLGRGQLVINIPLTCLYHGVPANFVIPSPPLPNPIPIDLYDVQFAVLNCFR